MDQIARTLAELLLTSGKDSFSQSFELAKDGAGQGEDIYVFAVRVKSNHATLVRQYSAENIDRLVLRATAKPAGELCPVCKGRGRLT